MTVHHDTLAALSDIKDILLGISGGTVAYLLDYAKAKKLGDSTFKFLVSMLLINIAMGAFVAYIVGSSISSDMAYRDAIVGFSGVTSYNILLLAESRFAEWVVDKLSINKKEKWCGEQ